jgi:hypothetical protein
MGLAEQQLLEKVARQEEELALLRGNFEELQANFRDSLLSTNGRSVLGRRNWNRGPSQSTSESFPEHGDDEELSATSRRRPLFRPRSQPRHRFDDRRLQTDHMGKGNRAVDSWSASRASNFTATYNKNEPSWDTKGPTWQFGGDEVLGSSRAPVRHSTPSIPIQTRSRAFRPSAKITVDLLEEGSDSDPQDGGAPVVMKPVRGRLATPKGRVTVDLFDVIEPRSQSKPSTIEEDEEEASEELSPRVNASLSRVSETVSLGCPENLEHIRQIEQLRNEHRLANDPSARPRNSSFVSSDGESTPDSDSQVPEVVDLWRFNSIITPAKSGGGGTQLPALADLYSRRPKF